MGKTFQPVKRKARASAERHHCEVNTLGGGGNLLVILACFYDFSKDIFKKIAYRIRDAKTLQTYKPGLEEGFGQKLRKV